MEKIKVSIRVRFRVRVSVWLRVKFRVRVWVWFRVWARVRVRVRVRVRNKDRNLLIRNIGPHCDCSFTFMAKGSVDEMKRTGMKGKGQRVLLRHTCVCFETHVVQRPFFFGCIC